MSQTFREQHAKQFWCPHARIATVLNMSDHSASLATVNRNPDRTLPFQDAECIGKKCANWTWKQPGQHGPNDEGYCGLSK